MKKIQILLITLIFGVLTISSLGAFAETPEDLKTNSYQALSLLEKSNPTAASISKQAKAVLIFPSIVKAGLVFGGAYGEGILIKDNKFNGFFNAISASFGWQAGAQSYGYIIFLMNEKAIQSASDTNGWAVGIDPSVVVVNEGAAKNLSTSTLKDGAYAFIFDQKGLMASLDIQGTKVSRINKP